MISGGGEQITVTPPSIERLLVKTIKGPKRDRLVSNVVYTFTVTEFNRSATEEEKLQVNWAWQKVGGEPTDFPSKGYIDDDGNLSKKIYFDENLIGNDIYIMPYMKQPITSVSVKIYLRQRCTGSEQTHVIGLGNVPSYTGEFPSPFQAMWYVPENNEIFKLYIPDKEIKGWIKNAAAYHGIPHVMLATILQQENSPAATGTQKFLQFSERTITTFMAVVDELAWDLVPDKIPQWSPAGAGSNLAAGSSGFANMARATLRNAANYTEEYYGKNPLSQSVRYRIGGWDQDTRIPGDDWKADLYYCASHLRELIDSVTGDICHSGGITKEQLEKVFSAYNGSGPVAAKYGKDAMARINKAINGIEPLYFYEK